mmetsp:Transcript_49513/g.50309  ORF Transcript_49513/g.50309 Transcript_49513/m.50309 type:complete len:214 (+) Transcript_49513:212-853(+)
MNIVLRASKLVEDDVLDLEIPSRIQYPTGHICRSRTTGQAQAPLISVLKNNFCTRRAAIAKSAGIAAGVAVATVRQPAYAEDQRLVFDRQKHEYEKGMDSKKYYFEVMKHGDEMRLADKKLELDRNKHEDEQQNHQDNVVLALLTIVTMVVTGYLPEVVIKAKECVTGVVGKAKECFNANTFPDKGKKSGGGYSCKKDRGYGSKKGYDGNRKY